MIDCPLYRHAMRSNQSGGRGWEFNPKPVDHTVSLRPSLILVVIAAVVVAASLVGMVLQ